MGTLAARTDRRSREAILLGNQRGLFDLPADHTYLNCAAMSPQLRAVTAAGIESVRLKRTPWLPEDWFAGAETLRATFARLIGADADGVALVPAASYGIATAAANLPLARHQNIVVLAGQFPSNVYAWRELARGYGAELRSVRKPATDAWTSAVLDAIDDGTAIVAVPNCHWTDGALLDLVRIGERARAAGAALVVDASQSLGAFPLDVGKVQPDFLVAVGYKWLLGPYSLGYLYAAPRWRQRGRPLEASWVTRANAGGFGALVDYCDDYRPGARRFDMGEVSQFVLAPMAQAALEQLLDWGVERVQATLAPLTARIADGARELGAQVLDHERRVGHIVGLRFKSGIPEALRPRLAERNIHVAVRGDAIRVSPHLYNDEADVDRFLSTLRESI
jgi:selenocysteine lyase/cysteine desulfurase